MSMSRHHNEGQKHNIKIPQLTNPPTMRQPSYKLFGNDSNKLKLHSRRN
jgi:hypothetical protein